MRLATSVPSPQARPLKVVLSMEGAAFGRLSLGVSGATLAASGIIKQVIPSKDHLDPSAWARRMRRSAPPLLRLNRASYPLTRNTMGGAAHMLIRCTEHCF